MSRGPQTFRQNDVTKALKGAVAAGFDPARVEIDRDGKIIIIVNSPAVAFSSDAVNEWDGVK
ncbi:hypothetical protein CK489_29040 [Bradyrhizobium sp. UFLA03-84]|uniref:hypothetical protein n=1 Tax=Bradyrhizobium sp. UFLA03-84 TaxID=418599 RepID=UPI000BD3E7BF|nr:hypothetical protein [Bradyrhizobium sp. UFLA03-84]PAY05431.1 hypothetical protein CK489_29040 [Bradyrhizobium sp. UFLA03-84]